MLCTNVTDEDIEAQRSEVVCCRLQGGDTVGSPRLEPARAKVFKACISPNWRPLAISFYFLSVNSQKRGVRSYCLGLVVELRGWA